MTFRGPANRRHLAKLKRGVEVWNQWRRDKPEIEPNLGAANLIDAHLSHGNFSGTNLRAAALSYAYVDHADLSYANLSYARLNPTYLQFANLSHVDLSYARLSYADLNDADLSHANLSHADLTGADLGGVDLSHADLTDVKALMTNFEKATLSGAVIEDWHIGKSTRLDGVKCDYIYRKRDPKTGKPTARLPADSNSTFAPGEFAQRFKIFESALETIDLTFSEGLDWKAFFASFQELRQQYPDDEIAIQGIENKGDAFIVRLEVSQQADEGRIEARAKQLYATQLKVIETQYEKQLRAQGNHLEDVRRVIEVERREKATLMRVFETMANQQGPKYDFRGSQFTGGYVGGNVEGNQNGGTVNNYGANNEDIARTLNMLRKKAEGLPIAQKDEALDTINALETNLAKLLPDQDRIRKD